MEAILGRTFRPEGAGLTYAARLAWENTAEVDRSGTYLCR